MANKDRVSSASTQKISRVIEGNPVQNSILLGLPAQEYDFLSPQLTFLEMRVHDLLQESEQIIRYAYFIESGLVSILSILEEGKTVEVGVFGKEGCSGLPLTAGLKTSAARIVTQIPGGAFRMTSQVLTKALPQCPALTKRMQQFGHIMAMQGAQVAACNRLHEVDERLARWLLMSQDRIESDVIPLTHEFLAHMLGTRRSSVTVAAGLLAQAGLISYNRGEVKIEDRARLEDAACECYGLIVRHTATWNKEAL